MKTLSGKQLQQLKALAHHLEPLVFVGKNGLTENVVDEIERALNDHELIKLKFKDFKDEKKALSKKIAQTTRCLQVALVGNIATFYREQPDPKKRKVSLSKKPSAENTG